MPSFRSLSLLFLPLTLAHPRRHPGDQLFARQDAVCVSETHQPDWYTRNLATVRKIYDLTVYPNNMPVIIKGAAAVPPGLFAPNATGRVSPVGDFESFDDSVEYFFALAPAPQTNPAATAFIDAQVVDFVSACPNVAASLVYFRSASVSGENGTIDESKPKSTLSQVSFWHFDNLGRVDAYQSWIPNLQAWTLASSGIDYTNRGIQTAAVSVLCPVIQQRCTGANQQYASTAECVTTLDGRPFGNFDEAWGDNLVCRTIHLLLTVVRPDVHCPHVGPTGGEKCVDVDYSKDYFDDEGLFKRPLGSVFTCSGPLQPDGVVGPGPGAGEIFEEVEEESKEGKLPGIGGAITETTEMGSEATGAPTSSSVAAQSSADALAGKETSSGTLASEMKTNTPTAQSSADALPGKVTPSPSPTNIESAVPPSYSDPDTAPPLTAQSSANALPEKATPSPSPPNIKNAAPPPHSAPNSPSSAAAQSTADAVSGKQTPSPAPTMASSEAPPSYGGLPARSSADALAGKSAEKGGGSCAAGYGGKEAPEGGK